MKKPRVVVRRMYDREAYAVWFGESDLTTGLTRFAKPLKMELDDHGDGWQLPEPTFQLPREQVVDFFKQLSEQLSMQGDPSINPHDVLKAKDENLKDLRSIIDRLFIK